MHTTPPPPGPARRPCPVCGRSPSARARGACAGCRAAGHEALGAPWTPRQTDPSAWRDGRSLDEELGLPTREAPVAEAPGAVDLTTCQLCEAPLAHGRYCSGCQRRFSAASRAR